MRHRKKKKLSSGYDRDRRLLRAWASALILHEKVKTTAKRGKLIRTYAERLISKGKSPDLHQKRQLFSALPAHAARKVFEVLGPKYQNRQGGYTRLARLGKSKNGTELVRVELV